MKSAIAHLLPEVSRFGRMAFALSLAVTLHLLFFRFSGYPLLNDERQSRAKPITLQLRLSPPVQSKPLPQSIPEPAPSTKRESPVTPTDNPRSPHQADAPETRLQPHEPAPSSAALFASARELTQQMADDYQTTSKPEQNKVETALNRAFNPQKEPPGVESLTDGTIRVVTDWGLVYCVKATEDWRILRPEDNLPMNMICN